MPRLFLEPRAVPADALGLERAPLVAAGAQSVDLIAAPNPRSALAGAGLAACLVGLLGVDAGLIWLVAGVWSVRAVASRPVGLAWGIACLAVGLRWGTVGVGDVEVATRLVGPTLATGGVLVRAGMIVALAGALVGEGQIDGLRAKTWGERGASGLALLALVPLFFVEGFGDPLSVVALEWGALATAVTLVVLAGAPIASRVPSWFPVALATAGLLAASTMR